MPVGPEEKKKYYEITILLIYFEMQRWLFTKRADILAYLQIQWDFNRTLKSKLSSSYEIKDKICLTVFLAGKYCYFPHSTDMCESGTEESKICAEADYSTCG